MIFGIDFHPERMCSFQRVDDMKIVSKAFSKIFPRMDRSIRADKIILPVRARSLFVIAPQSFRVVISLVTKNGTTFIKAPTIAHQFIPNEMSNLMPEMPKNGAIRLIHLVFDFFTLHV